MKKEKLGAIQIIIANVLSGFLVVLIRLGQEMGSQTMAFFRVFLAALFIIPLFIVSKKIKLTPFRKEKTKLIFFGLMHAAILLLYFISLTLISIASASLLISTLAIWTIVFSYFILNEKVSNKTWIALSISIIGMIIVVYSPNLFIGGNIIGYILALSSALFASLVYVLSKTFKHYDKVSLTFYQNLIAAPFLIPLLFLSSTKLILNSFNIVILVSIGLVGAASFIFMFKGFGNISGQKGGVLTLLFVIFAIIFAIIFFSEYPTINEILGGILILWGSYLVTRK